MRHRYFGLLGSLGQRLPAFFAFLTLLLTVPAAFAVPSEYRIYIDRDNNAATGCTVALPSGPMSGVEEILTTTVNTTTPPNAGTVGPVTQSLCVALPSTFGPATVIYTGPHAVGIGNGTAGSNVTETFWPLPSPKPLFVRVALVAEDDAGGTDELSATTPGGGAPIIIQLGSILEIPTLSVWGVVGLSLLLFTCGAWLLRRRRATVAAFLFVLAGTSAVWAATVVLDGLIGDWAPGTLVATDASGDGTLGSEILALFAQVDDTNARLAFRIDGTLAFNQAPVANDQSPAAGNEDTPQNLTLTGSDPDADPLTFTIVTPPTNGTLSALTNPTATSVDVTYTPNANFNGADSFVFQVQDTAGGTDNGTVSLTVTAVDDTPVAVNDAATVAEDSGASAIAVLANDTDVDAGPISITAVTQPANGTVVITGGGTGLTYQPNPNYCNNPPGTTLDTFTYTLTPGGSVATVTMTVTCVDDSPVAVDDAATVTEDDPATAVPVLGNDTDLDGGPMSISAVTQPANGTVVITGGGTGLTYQPNPNYCNNPPGTTLDTFTYTLAPGGDSATVTMTVTCVDDSPVAVDDAATVTEDDPATAVNVLANDTDADGGAISITSVTQPANGTVVITGGGTGLTYQPNADYCNSVSGHELDTFTYTLTPGGDTATVTMTVTCVDDNPVAVDDAATVNEDSGANAVAVLANDTDVDAGPISITSVTQPTNGTVVITGGGTGLTYQPNTNYCNSVSGIPDTFTYTLTPGGSVATVTMTVTCIDDAPVAVADAATVNEDSGANAVNVLANDTDLDGGPISVFSVTQPTNGAVVITGGGTGVTYQPNANYCNSVSGIPDTFTYTLTPGSSSTTVTMTVTCLNDAPALDLDADDSGGTAGADYAITFTEGDPATLLEDAADAVITDIDSANLASITVTLTNLFDTTFEVLSANTAGTSVVAGYVTVPGAPGTGTLTLTGPDTVANFQTVLRTVRYVNSDVTPDATPRVITFVANDGVANGNTATSTVTVVPVDSPPNAVDDAATVAEDSGATAINVLGNDTDPDAGPMSITSVTQPANGTVVITGGGTGLTYQPNANYCNSVSGPADTFTYTLTPGGDTATVSVTVTCVDDNPVAVADAATVLEDASATAIPVLANDTDADGGPISITSVTQPANGAVVITGGGTGLTYAPNANYCNSVSGVPDTFTYTLTPGGSSTTVTMTVTCVDDNPVAVADAATVTEDAPATPVNVLANDTDVDGGAISVTSVTQPANGTVVITGGGTGVNYTPNPNYCNSISGPTLDTFTYTLTPGGSSTTVSMTVTCVDDPPVAVNDAAAVNEDSGANAIAVLANDTDPDGGPISITSVTQPTNGTVVITGGGTGLTYQPNINFCNNPPGTTPDSFTYTLTPGGSVATVTVTVNCINDPPVADNDAFDFIGNTDLVVDLAALATPHALETTGTTFGVIDGDSDPVEGDAISVTAITVGACIDSSAPLDCSDPAVGRVQMQSNGRFQFTPAPGDAGASETFQYTLTDNGVPAPASVVATVTLTRFERVWYVRNDAAAGGNGTAALPFNSITAANLSDNDGDGDLTDDLDFAGDYLFVYFGDGATTNQAGGLVLEGGQHLIGQHAGLSLNVNLNANGAPTNLVAALPGSRPLLDDTVVDAFEGVSARNLVPNEIVGMNLAGNVNAIDWTTTAAFAGVGSFSIRDNVVRSAGNEGVDINLAGTGAVNLAFHDNNLNATGTAFDLQETGTGAVTITAFDDNTVNGNTGGSGIVVNNAVFDQVPGGAAQQVPGGTTLVGAPGNGVGGAAMSLSSVSGDLFFTDLDLFADGGAGLAVSGTVSMTFGTGTGASVSATGGPAVNISAVALTLPLSALSSSNSPTTGVALNSVTGSFSAPGSSSITNITSAAGTAFQVGSSNATVSYAGTITNTLGRGIDLTSNTGSTISFTGALTLTSATNVAFNATGGGTVSTTNTASTLSTTTGTALNVANTTIGSGGLVFRSIAANGGTNGIVLNTTGATAGLTVAGTGSNNTGGIIQNTSGDGISLTSTRNVSLTEMRVFSSGGNNIEATTVTNLTLNSMEVDSSNGEGILGSTVTNLVISGGTFNRGGADSEPTCNINGITLNNLLGTSSITDATFSRANTIQMRINNNTATNAVPGPPDTLTVTGTTWNEHNGPCGGDHLSVNADTGGNFKLITNSTSGENNFGAFTGPCIPGNCNGGGSAVQVTISGSGKLQASLTGLDSSNTTTGVIVGTGGGATGLIQFDVFDNTTANGTGFTNTGSFAMGMTCNAGAGGICEGAFRNNRVIHNAGTGTDATQIIVQGDGTGRVRVENNVVSGNFQRGLNVNSGGGEATPTPSVLHMNITGNNYSSTDIASLQGMNITTSLSGDATAVNEMCLNLASNTVTMSGGVTAYRLLNRAADVFQLQNFPGNGSVVADIQNWVSNAPKSNVGTPVAVTINQAYTTSAGCTAPTLPTP